MQIIEIPPYFNGTSMHIITEQINQAYEGEPKQSLGFDFSKLEFVSPVAIVFLSNVFHWLANVKGIEVNLTGLDLDKKGVKFLDDSLFIEQHCGSKQNSTAENLAIRQFLWSI